MPEKSVTLENLPTALRKAAAQLKSPLTNLAKSYGLAREKMTDLAPRVVSLFNKIRAEVNGFTQADFARIFDPSVPAHAADTDAGTGYRNHRMFYTIGYMIRTEQQRNRPRGRQGRRDPAGDQLARALATVLQVVKDADPIWLAVAREFGIQGRGLERLKTRVSNTEPLINLSSVKPVAVGANNVIHMERTVAAKVEAEPLSQPGRRVRVKSQPQQQTAAA